MLKFVTIVIFAFVPIPKQKLKEEDEEEENTVKHKEVHESVKKPVNCVAGASDLHSPA